MVKLVLVHLQGIAVFSAKRHNGAACPLPRYTALLTQLRHSKRQYRHALPSVTYVGPQCSQHAG